MKKEIKEKIIENWKKTGFSEFIFDVAAYYYENKLKKKPLEATSLARRDIKNIEGFLKSQIEDYWEVGKNKQLKNNVKRNKRNN